MGSVDEQARAELSQLACRFGELAADYWGVNRNDGKRGELVQLLESHAELKTRLLHYLDAEREQTCLGLKEFEKRDKFKAEINKEVVELESAKVTAGATRDVAKYQMWSQTIIQMLVLIGVIFVAVFK